MVDATAMPIVPDYLSDLLDDEIEEIFAGDSVNDRLRLPRMTVPQISVTGGNPELYGKIILTPIDKEAEPKIVDSVRLMLIDTLTFSFRHPINGRTTPRHFPQDILADDQYKDFVSLGKEGIGARTMWKLTADNKRDMAENTPVCKSDNGVTPWKTFIGKEILDPRRGEIIRIGEMITKDALGEDVVIRSKYPCLTCPLGRFMKSADGKNLPPVCGHTPEFVVYNVDDGQLYTLRGQNRGLLMSLLGHPEPKKPTDFTYWNGDIAYGLEYFFATAGQNKHAKKALTVMLEREPDVLASLSRPLGMPKAATPEAMVEAPVYPVEMTITLSNFQTAATLVPQFHLCVGGEVLRYGNPAKKQKLEPADRVRQKHTISAAPLSPIELTGWLMARKLYHDENYRETLMALADIRPGIRVGAVTPEMLGAGSNGHAALPAGAAQTPPWSDADIQED